VPCWRVRRRRLAGAASLGGAQSPSGRVRKRTSRLWWQLTFFNRPRRLWPDSCGSWTAHGLTLAGTTACSSAVRAAGWRGVAARFDSRSLYAIVSTKDHSPNVGEESLRRTKLRVMVRQLWFPAVWLLAAGARQCAYPIKGLHRPHTPKLLPPPPPTPPQHCTAQTASSTARAGGSNVAI
jgi:hypothetical protein